MDFLNKYFAQIRELFEGMTPGARITSALLLAVTVVSLGYLFTSGFNPGGDVFLLDNRAFTSDELAAMEGAFAVEGLGDYEIVAGRIRVPGGKKTAYVAALAKGGVLPHDFNSILDESLSESSTFEDKTKFQTRNLYAKQKYLAEVFRSMSGIDNAGVMVDEVTKPGLKPERMVVASVNVKRSGTLPLDDTMVNAIRQTMEHSFAGLRPENVTILDMNAKKTYRGTPSDAPGGDGTMLAQEQRRQEERFRTSIEALLSYVPGVIVTPTVELSPLKKQSSRITVYDKDNSVSVSLNEVKSSRDFTGEAKGGRPGYVVQQNTPRSLGTTESKGAEEKEKTSELVETKLPAGEETEKEYAAHILERVSVAIAVPKSYFTKIWLANNPTPNDEDPQEPTDDDINKIRTEEIAKITDLVAASIPEPKDGQLTRTDLVEVRDFEDLAPPPIPEPTMTETAGSWLAENWGTVSLIFLGLFSLLMLRSMIRSAPSGSSDAMAHLAGLAREDGDMEEDEEEKPRKIGFAGTGASLQDELSELVATDPETAANILKNWIGSGAK